MQKVPRKKARKAASPKMVFLLLLCACLVTGAAVFAVRSLSRPIPISEPAEKVMLLKRKAEEIASVRIAPLDSEAYTLLPGDNGFVMAGFEEAALRESVMEEITLSLGNVPAEAVVLPELNPAQGLTLAAFGMEPPQARVEITYQDGEKRELLLGNAAPNQDTPQRYCMIVGDSALYTLLEADCEAFFHEREYLFSFRQPQLDGSLLDRIDVTGDVVWSAYYTPSGWQMEAPFVYPLSVQRMDALLSRIESMGFEAYLGAETPETQAQYGLDAPEVTVRLTQAATVITGETEDGQQVSIPVPEQEYLLRLGRETGKSGVYLSWAGGVYKASNFLLGFWKTLNPHDLALTNPVNFQVNNLDEVTIEAAGVSQTYEVRMVESVAENNQIAVDEYGQTLYDLAARRAGETEDMDAEAFAAWYRQLATLSGDGALPDGFVLSGESRGTVTLKNDHLTRVIGFYPFDALHDALAIDGVALFYVSKDWLNEAVAAMP